MLASKTVFKLLLRFSKPLFSVSNRVDDLGSMQFQLASNGTATYHTHTRNKTPTCSHMCRP